MTNVDMCIAEVHQFCKLDDAEETTHQSRNDVTPTLPAL